ncbi:MAG: hypothetical protein FJ029_03915 [Actinobacteria bacterium]|nr:hypothetical protein [Actinomycetota bacterium]
MNVLFCNDYMPDIVAGLQAAMPEHGVRTCPEAAVRAAVADVDVILPSRAQITAEVMDAAPRLKLIQQAGIGTDMVDRAAARARHIPVANVPAAIGGLGQAVAEMALFLMIGGGRNYPAMARSLASADWRFPYGWSVFGARVCLVGLGGIGATIARLLRPFQCELIGVKRRPDPALARDLGLAALYTADRLSEAARGCRFLVLALPLDASTRGLIDAGVLNALAEPAVVVNVARAAIIARPALLDALRTRRVSVAALDVFWEEPADPKDELFGYDVFATPHASSACDLYVRDTSAAVAANVRRLIEGKPLQWIVDMP